MSFKQAYLFYLTCAATISFGFSFLVLYLTCAATISFGFSFLVLYLAVNS